MFVIENMVIENFVMLRFHGIWTWTILIARKIERMKVGSIRRFPMYPDLLEERYLGVGSIISFDRI